MFESVGETIGLAYTVHSASPCESFDPSHRLTAPASLSHCVQGSVAVGDADAAVDGVGLGAGPGLQTQRIHVDAKLFAPSEAPSALHGASSLQASHAAQLGVNGPCHRWRRPVPSAVAQWLTSHAFVRPCR